MNELDFYTSERIISEKYSFHAGLERADGNTISQSKVISNGSLNQNKFIQIRADHTQNFHSVTVRFNEEVVISGVTIRFRIRNWEDVQYLAIGSNADGK